VGQQSTLSHAITLTAMLVPQGGLRHPQQGKRHVGIAYSVPVDRNVAPQEMRAMLIRDRE
jgi:hypothetical protein